MPDVESPSLSPPTQVTFDWKEERENTSGMKKRAIGFVAQEVQTSLPELVHRFVGGSSSTVGNSEGSRCMFVVMLSGARRR